MAQQEHNAFKEQLKQWMIDNPNDYEEFEDMMNNRSSAGYNSIMFRAMTLLPRFQKAFHTKFSCDNNIDISDIIEMAKEEKLADKLLLELNATDSDNFTPAMLTWIYYGRSFENMVERGEEILKLPQTSWFEKIYVTFGIKLIISQSKKLEFRTKEDWEKYNKLRSIITEGKAIEWAIKEEDSKENTLDTPQTINDIVTFASMLTLSSDKKKILIADIADYLRAGAKGKSVAFMILALRELNYLPKIYSDRSVFKAIRIDFSVNIGTDRGIYKYVDKDIACQYIPEVKTLVAYFKVN